MLPFFLLISLFQYSQAFPGHYLERAFNSVASNISAAGLENLKARGLLDLGNVIGLIPTSLDLGPVASIGRKRIPDSDHPFIAPGPNDIRGGCPGLNIMANYGYISRNGITNVAEVIYAQQEMLGLAPDLAIGIALLGVRAAVDITTLKMSIGKTDSRTDGPLTGLFGTAPGLFSPLAHNKFEIDGSLSRPDRYFEHGDSDHFDSNYWKKFRDLAFERYNGLMTREYIGEARFIQYKTCRYTNPECEWALGEQLVHTSESFLAYALVSADVHGNPSPPHVKDIETFFGIIENPDGSFSRGNGMLPPSADGYWYRRATPLTLAEQFLSLKDTFLAYPMPFGRNNGSLGHWNDNLTDLRNLEENNLLCYFLQQTRDPANSRYSKFPLVNDAFGKLLRNTLKPLFEQLSC
ncbi:Chloroperoxidase [Melampsora americana]|nr:Chloroperoxidase [Melampsora americana]